MANDAEHLEQLRLHENARRRFLADVPLLSAEGIGRRIDATVDDPVALATQLRHAGVLIAVTHGGDEWFPAAQIVRGRPSPAIRQVRAEFEGEPEWMIALWLNAPSGWLGGEYPMDLLDTDPDRVVDAARRTATPLEI